MIASNAIVASGHVQRNTALKDALPDSGGDDSASGGVGQTGSEGSNLPHYGPGLAQRRPLVTGYQRLATTSFDFRNYHEFKADIKIGN